MDDSKVSQSGEQAVNSLAYAQDWETTSESDGDLVRRSVSGDDDAFSEIITSYQRRVYGLALRMTRRHEVADDVTQETFIRAYRNLDRFEIGRPLVPWLLRIARNLSINHLKSRAAKEQSLYTEDMPEGPEPSFESADKARAHDPHRVLVSAEFSEALDEAMGQLSEEYRAVFILRVVEDMRYDEIANALGISKGTVMSRLFRARAKLKAIMKDHL